MDVQEIQAVVLNILAFVLLLTTLQPPLDDGRFPLQQRLLPDFHGCTFYGRDVFSLISGQLWLFWGNTGETPGSFLRLALDLLPSLSSLTACGQPRITQRRQKITLINQVLLTIIWLRKYPHVDTLSLWFDIDPSSVVCIVYKVLPELWRSFQNQISWPTLPEWRNLMGNWEEFPNVVGVIDTTQHEIYRPLIELIEPQRPFYKGYRHYHCMNTQLVIDSEGHIRFVQAGFLGSTHDAVSTDGTYWSRA